MTQNKERPRTEDDREGKIIKFIKDNPFCSRQKVVEGFENNISRVTVYKILDKLIESGAVHNHLENKQKTNSRQHRLYVDEGNPLVAIRLELEEFESAFFDLFVKALKVKRESILTIIGDVSLSDEVRSRISKAVEESISRQQQIYNKTKIIIDPESIEQQYNGPIQQQYDKAVQQYNQEYNESVQRVRQHFKEVLYSDYRVSFWYGQLVSYMLSIFYSMVDACLFRFLLIWTEKIPDQQVLQRLYTMVFSKIADMQTRLSGIVISLRTATDRDKDLGRFIFERFRGSKVSKPILQYFDSFKKLGMENENERVIDALWKIIGDLQPNVYPEPKLYGWPFKYGEDDWRKLVRLLKQHPKSSPFGPDLK